MGEIFRERLLSESLKSVFLLIRLFWKQGMHLKVFRLVPGMVTKCLSGQVFLERVQPNRFEKIIALSWLEWLVLPSRKAGGGRLRGEGVDCSLQYELWM